MFFLSFPFLCFFHMNDDCLRSNTRERDWRLSMSTLRTPDVDAPMLPSSSPRLSYTDPISGNSAIALVGATVSAPVELAFLSSFRGVVVVEGTEEVVPPSTSSSSPFCRGDPWISGNENPTTRVLRRC
eukprot:PhM_4_TR11468/c0_g1_i1/m.67373